MLFTPVSKAEPSPMEKSYEGNPIVIINLTYESGIGGGNDIQGDIVLELFINWAPITVTNFVDLVEQSFYDDIFNVCYKINFIPRIITAAFRPY